MSGEKYQLKHSRKIEISLRINSTNKYWVIEGGERGGGRRGR
jgi:hypothetical protein